MPVSIFRSHPAPIQDYTAAVQKIASLQAAETAIPGFDPRLKTILLDHGKKTRRAVLWFHGYTSATLQFKPLAELCHRQGYNAFVPCIPHHGFKDRLSGEVSRIDARELVRFTEQMVDLVHGLGDEVVVGGLSMGGVMAAWVAQERPDVSVAITIAPFLGARIVPTALTRPFAYGAQILPDIIQWWDAEKKEHNDGPDYAYPQRSTHSLSQILQLGFQVFALAGKNPPAAGKVWAVINDHDEAVNNPLVERLAKIWERSKPEDVQTFHFPDELGIPHDCISVEQPRGNTPVVYAELMKMVGREA
jgi:pimeloyl-ACP methyl ester carboxylesterase